MVVYEYREISPWVERHPNKCYDCYRQRREHKGSDHTIPGICSGYVISPQESWEKRNPGKSFVEYWQADQERMAAIRAEHEAGERPIHEALAARGDTTDDYREGFIDGYLRAHDDGEEYQCSVKQAEWAYERFLLDGGRSLIRQDVPGW